MLRKLIARWRRRRMLRAIRILVNMPVNEDISIVVANDDRVLCLEIMQESPLEKA